MEKEKHRQLTMKYYAVLSVISKQNVLISSENYTAMLTYVRQSVIQTVAKYYVN
jgi:hypothetical protein